MMLADELFLYLFVYYLAYLKNLDFDICKMVQLVELFDIDLNLTVVDMIHFVTMYFYIYLKNFHSLAFFFCLVSN